MPDFGIYAGDTSKTVYFRLRDSTTGLAKTGLAFGSPGADASYVLPQAASVPITLATLASASASWATGGFFLVNDTDAKGLYRFDLPNAAIASGDFTIISLEFDGIIEESMHIPLHTPKVNATELNSNATAATRLQQMFAATEAVVVDDATFTPTATVFETEDTSDDSEDYDKQVLFGVSGQNVGVTVKVTSYAFANSKVKLTVSPLKIAPNDGDIFLKMGRIGS